MSKLEGGTSRQRKKLIDTFFGKEDEVMLATTSFDTVKRVFDLAGLPLQDVTLLSIDLYCVQDFVKSFCSPSVQSDICTSGVKSIYVASLANRSPWFALVLKSRIAHMRIMLASRLRARDVEGRICSLLVDDVDKAMAQCKHIGIYDASLELEDINLHELPKEAQRLVVLDSGRGFYETLVDSSLRDC